jgi:hypothetical protein
MEIVSGWALRPCGDIYDIHTYQTEVYIPPISLNMASVIGEYGGIGYPITNYLWNPEMRNWATRPIIRKRNWWMPMYINSTRL